MAMLIDRYLYAVEEALPRDVNKADIVAEIRDDLESQCEEREAYLGRSLTIDEEEAILRAYGHPRVVAARYGRVQYLIGPDLFPFFWATMRNVVTAGVALVLLAGSIAAIALHNGLLFFDTLGVAWNTALWIAATILIIFAVAERVPHPHAPAASRFSRAWDPRKLPAPGGLPPVKTSSSLASFIANALMLLVLLDAPAGAHHIPLDIMVTNILRELHVTLTTAWYPAYYAAIAGSALLVGSAITVFVRPHLTLIYEGFRVFASAITMAGLAVTLANGPWVVAREAAWNAAIEISLIVAIAAFASDIALSARAAMKQLAQRSTLPI